MAFRFSGRSWCAVVLIVGVGVLSLGVEGVQAQRFLPDDPVWEDPDRMDIPFVPSSRSRSESFEPFNFLSRTFGQPGNSDGRAVNVNTLGEVPNSSWYTNRHYFDRMSLAALRRGPNRADPPSTEAPWKVVRVGERGGLPVAEVIDARDRRYTIRVDSRAHPEMATGAAMVGSRLLHALGYNVAEHYLLNVYPEQLQAVPDSGVTREAVWELLNASATRANLTYRVLATRMPDAEATVGPFSFFGTRKDDPNDIFPHEARRELRGLEVISAWMQHSRIREAHTLDAVVRDGDRRYVRHYLTDLFLTLGSAGGNPKPRWSGHEHILEVGNVFTRIGTLGMSGGEWMNVPVPDIPGIGYVHAEEFVPEEWKPEYPNPAFERADGADRFWAARKVAHFTREEIRAIVESGNYSDVRATGYLVRVLMERQAAVARAYLYFGGGLDRFRVVQGQLQFEDLRRTHGMVGEAMMRRVTWQVFDNEAGVVGAVLQEATTDATTLAVPEETTAAFLRVDVQTPGVGRTLIYLRRTPDGRYEVVGVRRSQGT